MLTTILLVIGCIVVTVLVVVLWSMLVLGARCDAQADALQRLLNLNDKGNYPREED